MMTHTKYWVIIPAAGVGQRFGALIPKQYMSLNGKPIIEHTLAKFLYHPKIEKIVVAIDAKDCLWQQLGLNAYSDKIIVTTGGTHRCHSVFAGLLSIAEFANPQDFVLVHDAVRPCITHGDIDKLINEVNDHPVGGILGVRVTDTLKCSNRGYEIIDTVSRENIWQALTPQMFRFKLLLQALQQNILENRLTPDEAAAIETLGFIPMIIEGRRDNIKITYAEDLLLADFASRCEN